VLVAPFAALVLWWAGITLALLLHAISGLVFGLTSRVASRF